MTSTAESVHAAFERRAATFPDAVAISMSGQCVTYGELNARANQLSRHLRGKGVDVETPVGVCMERSVDTVVALIAVLKAGGHYVALDPRQPRERHALLTAEAGIRLVLTQERLLAQVSGLADILVIDSDTLELTDLPTTDLALPVQPDHAVYVAYTSGSTGRPKGACITHRAVLRLVQNSNFLAVEPDDAFLMFAPLAFDASTLEIWAPLLGGARLAVVPPGEPSLAELAETVVRERVTVLWLTAGLFHQMAEGPMARMTTLRQLLAGGDVLSPHHVNRTFAALPGIRLVNGYGPTENTTFTCCHIMEGPVDGDTVPIGRPVTGTEVYVLDDRLRPVPDGESGELYAGGAGVARGYVGRADLTADRFLPDPFGSEPGARMYRTGDLVKRRTDGVVEYLGRLDHQVKVRGFRVEPGEIDTVLLAHPGVKDACVVVHTHTEAGKRLAAFYVCAENVGAADLRELLRRSLPPYMVPSVFARLEALPLTRNGKVDRAALAARQIRERPETNADFRAARTPVERQVADLWADLMGLDEVGVDDDFFELGGDSLLVTRIVTHIAERYGVELRPRDLYLSSTVAELAEIIDEALSPGAPAPAPSGADAATTD
ncbi:amino acid adenylation domain-containing protein [Streptomyces sp. NPDC005263]|uniref:amino acid adenylation domain-containing protein n=1 Tax=Streptomyces sp. NPDC005263 TaxID=3364711 RepID=UPI0036A9420A